MIAAVDRLYKWLSPLVMRTDPQWAHDQFIEALRIADGNPVAVQLAAGIGQMTQRCIPVQVGGVILPNPFILAAGLVKGDGFPDEDAAMRAVHRADNIMPGWRVMPALVGAVEFGSYTRYPRVGNAGTVIWRYKLSRTTQNRVGLRNPGAHAAAEFLHWHRHALPPVFGVNIAVSPGIDDPAQEKQEALEALAAFTQRGVRPSWFTLNLSCPNTKDDPHGNQTEAKARALCAALVPAAGDVPLWVKVSPRLSDAQYAGLMHAFAQTGVKAVIATNTLAAPIPNGSAQGGLGGGSLHKYAVQAAGSLVRAAGEQNVAVDVVGCGGVMDASTANDFTKLNVRAVQYYSAMVYRSPLAAAIIHRELRTSQQAR